jgi:serine/threonine protein kinase
MGSRRAGKIRSTERFAVRRRVRSGGMGVVYEAYDLERDMRVAIKTIRDTDASTLYRFKKVFRSLTDISHPNLVKIHELVRSDDQCFYTMEFVDGVDFLRYVCPAETPSPDNPLSPPPTRWSRGGR